MIHTIEVVLFDDIFDREKREKFLVACDGPKALHELLPPGWDFTDQFVHICIDGRAVERNARDEKVRPGSQVVVTREPGFAAFIAWAEAHQILFAVLTMAASALLTKALAPDAGKAIVEDNETESFRGFQNSYFSGGAIPIVLGERRIAPPVVGQIIESSFGAWSLSNRETMKLLLVLGHGPISGLGDVSGVVSTRAEFVSVATIPPGQPQIALAERIGLLINGQPASNFADVIIEWRTGEFDQDSILGFPDSSVDVVVDQELDEYSDAIDISETGFNSGVYTSGNDIDSTLGDFLSHTMVDEADRFVLTLFFPNGLYKDAGGGGLTYTTAKFRLQYWPVDSGGTRTGDTVLLPEIEVTSDEPVAKVLEIPGEFFSPTSYTGASQFGYIACQGVTAHAKVTAPVDADTFPVSFADPDTVKFSCQSWIRSHPSFGPASARSHPIFSTRKGSLTASGISSTWPWYPVGLTASAGHSGCVFALDYTHEAIGTWNQWRLALYTWSGTVVRVYFSPSLNDSGPFMDTWRHVGVTWDGKTNTPVFYLDGLPVAGFSTLHVGDGTGATTPRFYEEGDFVLGHNGTTVGGSPLETIVTDLDLVDITISDGVRDWTWFQAGHGTVDVWGHRISSIDAENDAAVVFASHLSEEIAQAKIEQLAFENSTTTGQVIDVIGSSLQAAPQSDSPLWTTDQGIPLQGRYHLELYRSNAVADDSSVEMNVGGWKSLTLILDQDFSSPGVAKLGISIDADDQVSNSRPTISMIERGMKVPVWTGFSAKYPIFEDTWTRNPAWGALLVVSEEEIGLGAIWNRSKNVDLPAWKEWADYCDEGVEDAAGIPAFFDGDFVAISGDHPYGEVHFKIGLLDASGVTTGESLPKTWAVGHTTRIKTASDATWLVASTDDAVRLIITAISYESDDAAPLNFQHWVQIECDWIDDYTLPTANDVTGTAVGFEARHELDIILDGKDVDGWGEMLAIMRASRAAPVIVGNSLSVVIDRDRDPDFILTQAQMETSSFSLGWTTDEDRYNSIEYEYVDRAQDYAVDFVSRDHPTISGETDTRKIRKQPPQLLRGVVRRSEVTRHAIYRLNQFHLLRKSCRFRLGPEGLGLSVYDHVLIAHDVPQIGEAGRLLADVAKLTEIKLDRDVIVTFGSTYEIEVRSSASVTAEAKEIRETVTLDASMIPGSGSTTIAAGATITLDGVGFAGFIPLQGDVYSFGETGETSEAFTVTKVTNDPMTMIRRVECVERDSNVYVDNEFGILPDDPGDDVDPPPTGGMGGGLKPPGQHRGHTGGHAFASIESTRRAADGKPLLALILSWPQALYSAGGTNIWAASLTDGSQPVPKMLGFAPSGAATYSVDASHFRSGQRVRFYMQPLGRTGQGRVPIMCPSTDIEIGGRVLPFAAPTIVAPKGRETNAVYAVEFPAGQTPEGVEVRVGGWLLGQKVASALRDGDLVSEQWVFGADNSAAQGAYQHQVRSLLPSGQVSAAALFTNADSVPLGGAVLSGIAHEDAWASGTLSNLVVDSSTSPPFLKWTGTNLGGSFDTPTLDMSAAKRYLVEIAVDGHQVHPTTLSEMTEKLNSRIYANWLLEGPVGGDDAELSHLSIQWAPSVTGTPAVTWSTLRPGVAFFRSTKFRIKITRPTRNFDCVLKRFGVRVISIPDYEPGDIDGGTF